MKNKIRYTVLFFFVLMLAGNSGFAQKDKNKKTTSSAYDYQGSFNNGLAKVKKDHKWGFIDTTGALIVPLKYNEVENFNDGLARVRSGQKWGLVDVTGRVVIKPTFDWIYDFENGMAKVKINGEIYYMNREGQRVK